MPAFLADEIRSQLCNYLAGEISVGDLHRWLLPATWNLHQQQDPTVQDLAGEVGLRLAEYAAGHLSEADLRAHLRALVDGTVAQPRESGT